MRTIEEIADDIAFINLSADFIIAILKAVPAEKRGAVLDEIKSSALFCFECGGDELPCYCWNDE